MKTPRYPLWTTVAVACIGLAASGCSTKKSSQAGGPAPKEDVQTMLVGVESTDGTTKVKYKSNVKDAKFKCQTEVEGKPSDWADCPADGAAIPTQQGVKYVFRVKAISPGGTESEPQPYSFTAGTAGQPGPQAPQGPQGPQGPGPAVNGALATQILNKGDVGQTYAKSSLTLRLGVKGDGVNVEKLRFECKREADADYRKCDTNDQAQYQFAQMIDGASYTLSVRARTTDTNLIASEDTIAFKVALAKLPITNATDLDKIGSGDVSLALDRAGLANARIQCTMDNAQPIDCPAGANGSILVQRSLLGPGSHSLRIVASDNQGNQLGASQLNFCMGSCTAPGGPQAPVVKSFQIGSFYEYLVPNDMHVTEYATTKTYNGALEFFRIMPESDPFYLGIYKCDGEFDTRMTAARPDGNGFNDYCQSTPQRDLYKWLTDYRLANNHLEVATNQELINGYNQDKILINVFDADYDYLVGRSRFDQLCMNKRGTITKTFRPIRFADNDFWGEAVRADFYMCVTELAGVGPGTFPISGEKWWVGAFFIHQDTESFPMYECYTHQDSPAGSYDTADYDSTVYDGKYKPEFCGTFRNKHVLEVVYMTRTPYMDPADFAHGAQQRFRKNLFELSPGN